MFRTSVGVGKVIGIPISTLQWFILERSNKFCTTLQRGSCLVLLKSSTEITQNRHKTCFYISRNISVNANLLDASKNNKSKFSQNRHSNDLIDPTEGESLLNKSKHDHNEEASNDNPIEIPDNCTSKISLINEVKSSLNEEQKPKTPEIISTPQLDNSLFKSIDNISASQGNQPVEDLVNSPLETKQLQIKTNKGKLIVTTTSEGTELQNIVLETKQDKTNIPSIPICKIEKDAEKEKESDDETKKNRRERRTRVDFNRSYLERNFITPARAISDFLLKQSDLDKLPKTKRRSPYEQEPPITVYWRKDVEQKAIEVWGSRENLLRECLKREIEKKTYQQNIFTVKRRLRDYRREIGSRTNSGSTAPGLKGDSGRVVVTAIAINACNFVFKIFAWLYTGSHSMFAESIHSLADTINQIILAYGIHKSVQIPDSDHPYGYANMRYVSSLISGVGIFCVGTGLSFYHGVMGLMYPSHVTDFFWGFCILGGSLISEGATLLVAINTIRRKAKEVDMSFKEYVVRSQDPCVNVVLFEDTAAVLSVFLASGCMGLSIVTNSSVPDAVGSLLVGGMLGAVASFIIYSNVNALVGRSILTEQLEKINSELESDIMIRAIHDVKGIDMGNSLVRYKAEMDFDGRELTRFYLDKQDLNTLLDEVKQFRSIEELEAFLLKHGEGIVDLMGGEIDRIELKLRKKFPEIRHCDLEIL